MEWQKIESAPKDGTEIIYLAMEDNVKPPRSPYFVGSARWHDGYEGDPEGWWDEACTMYAEPLFWMPLPEPPK